MSNCTRCGSSNPKGEVFCMRCGVKLEGSLPVTKNEFAAKTKPEEAVKPQISLQPSSHAKNKTMMYLIIGIIAAVVVILAILFATGVIKFPKDGGTVVQPTDEKASVDLTWESKDTLTTAFYTNKNQKLITFSVKSDKPAKVTIEIEIPDITEKQTETVDAGVSSKKVEFKPPFKADAYGPLREARDTYIKIVAKDSGGNIITDTTQSIRVLSRNDMVWVDADGTKNYQYIAKWVTKDVKEVQDLVRVAAEYNAQFCGKNAMVGYLGTEDDVVCQLASIFAAMEDYYGIRYVAAPESYQASNAQNTKLPEDVILGGQGLCIETVVLVASALENLGMEPVIVIIPGHAWVAVKAYAGAPYYFHLETTMLTSPVLDALVKGQANWDAYAGSVISIVDIKKAREDGILPFGEGGSKSAI